MTCRNARPGTNGHNPRWSEREALLVARKPRCKLRVDRRPATQITSRGRRDHGQTRGIFIPLALLPPLLQLNRPAEPCLAIASGAGQ